jgi:hypothetical protein
MHRPSVDRNAVANATVARAGAVERHRDGCSPGCDRLPTRPLSLAVARIAGRIDAQLRQKGVTMPTADLWIGATALELGFAVATGNVRHFRSIPALRVHVVR